MRETLIEFMDELREYVSESGTNISHDERDSSEFVDVFLSQRETLPVDSAVKCSHKYKGTGFMSVYEKCTKCGTLNNTVR